MKIRQCISLIVGSKALVLGCVLSMIGVHHLFSQKWLDSIAAEQDIRMDLEETCPGPGVSAPCLKEVNKFNSNGQTGLMVQARLGRYPDVKLLLKYKADPTIVSNDTQRTTALHLAARSVDFADGDKMVKLILRKGGRVDVRDAYGNTPLHELLSAASAEKKQTITKVMIDTYKADINAQNNDGDTPLHLAVKKNDLDWITYVMGKYPKVIKFELKNNQGNTIQAQAALYGYDEIVRIIQEAMAKVAKK